MELQILLIAAFGWIVYREWRFFSVNREREALRLELERHLAVSEKGEENLEKRLLFAFKELSQEALKDHTHSFLELATAKFEKLQEGARVDIHHRQRAIDDLLKPMRETLEKTNRSHDELQKLLATTHTSISEQVKGLAFQQTRLQLETQNLAKALRLPAVRGRWGEIQLRRVVEMAGMVNFCDFLEQVTVGQDGRRLRPDLVVKLPVGKQIVVDAKTPLAAYLDALEAESDEQKREKLAAHARQVKIHIQQLSSKGYWDQFPSAPEFVVLFLPAEPFFSAALEADPTLIEYGAEQKVIIATPTTLIALLRAVSYGWKQEQLSENAEVISKLGRELSERISTFSSHFGEIRRGLEKAVDAYNRSVASFEARVMPAARRLAETGGTGEETEPLESVDRVPRLLAEKEQLTTK